MFPTQNFPIFVSSRTFQHRSYLSIYLSIHTNVFAYAHIYNTWNWQEMKIKNYINKHTCTYTYKHIYTHTHLYSLVKTGKISIYQNLSIYIYIYIYIYLFSLLPPSWGRRDWRTERQKQYPHFFPSLLLLHTRINLEPIFNQSIS